jgi:hypothetical protein
MIFSKFSSCRCWKDDSWLAMLSKQMSWSWSWSKSRAWAWSKSWSNDDSWFKFGGEIWLSSANLVLVDVGKMILGIIFTKVKLGSIIIPDLLRMYFLVFSLLRNDWKAWYVDFLTRVVVCWGKKMNVCIKSVSDNYCWSSGRSSSVYFRRQIATSDLWSMSWFCSWSMFKPCSFLWTKRHSFSMHWNRSEQTAW